jgi:hypothetical protein
MSSFLTIHLLKAELLKSKSSLVEIYYNNSKIPVHKIKSKTSTLTPNWEKEV